MKLPDQDFIKTNKKRIFIAGSVACVAALAIFLALKKQAPDGYADGYILCNDESSDEIEDLFYKSGDRYLIELGKLDQCLDIDAMESESGYIVRNTKTQCTFTDGASSYKINANTISDDDNYIAPVENKKGFYADTDTLFEIFGYDTSYKTNSKGELVELTLTKSDGSAYDVIHIQKETPETEEARSQIEEGILNQDPETGKPGGTTLPTVPHPETAKTQTNEEPEETTGTAEEGSAASQEESVAETTIETEQFEPETQSVQIVDRLVDNPNKKTDEEFQKQWNNVSKDLQKIYATGTTPTGETPVKERNKDFIAYNPMSGAIFYDTISILHDPADGAFIEVTIADEWSDMALNTDHKQSQAFYNSIPGMVEATLKDVLGENAGTELFQFIKENADRTVNGGYIAYTDENNEIKTKWTDGPVGDGINAAEIDFEDWQNRTTDDGLRFYVARSSGGIFIKVFKN